MSLLPVTLGLVFLTYHVRNYSEEILSFVAMLWKICKDSSRHLPWAAASKHCEKQERHQQVNLALWEVRARTYRHSVQFLVHLAALGVLGMIHDICVNPQLTQLVHIACMSFVYIAHHSVCKEKLKLNALNLRTIYAVFYASFVFFALSNGSHQRDDARAIIDQGFNAGSRMIMSVIFIDTLSAIPAQVAISLVETGVHAMHHTSQDTLMFAWMQLIMSSGIIAISVVLEFWVTSHITALMDTECMVMSFRRMLRGVSDGEVILTEELCIAEEADCLKHLMMASGTFKGKQFEHLIVEDEVCRFKDFIKQSMAEAHKPEDQRTKTPPCLRVSLRGPSHLRVGVDLWHVCMPGRKDGVMHLLALREDGEARASIPVAGHEGESIEMQSLRSTEAGGTSERCESEASDCSWSQKSSASMMVDSFPELVDMTLCVDTSTHWFDIEQAHLSFARQAQSSYNSMPSLRRLVRPTDWETVRSQLKAVSHGNSMEEMRLRLVDDAKRSLIAQVQVSTFHPAHRGAESSIQLCLQLTDFVFEDPKGNSKAERSLTSIHE